MNQINNGTRLQDYKGKNIKRAAFN